MKRVKIAAGLCFADYGHIGSQVMAATEAGVDYIHAEAADQYVLPDHPLLGGPQAVAGIRPCTELPIEMHCYIRECNEKFIDLTADAGANRIILPFEYFVGGAPLAHLIIRSRQRGMQFGLMLDCISPASFMEEAIYWVDRIHVVTHDIDEAIRMGTKIILLAGEPATVRDIFFIDQDYPRERDSLEFKTAYSKIIKKFKTSYLAKRSVF